MVEHDVTALISQLLAAGLQGSVQNLVHPPHIGTHGDDRRQILQSPCMGSYIREAAIRNRNRVSTSILPCTSSTEPVSATDAIPA